MEYTVASAFARGAVGVSTFESDALDEDIVERLQSRVSLTTDSDLAYDSHEATVRIETDTSTYTERRENPPGTHDDPLSEDELREKFLECARRALSVETARTAYERVSNVRTADDLDTVVSVLKLRQGGSTNDLIPTETTTDTDGFQRHRRTHRTTTVRP